MAFQYGIFKMLYRASFRPKMQMSVFFTIMKTLFLQVIILQAADQRPLTELFTALYTWIMKGRTRPRYRQMFITMIWLMEKVDFYLPPKTNR